MDARTAILVGYQPKAGHFLAMGGWGDGEMGRVSIYILPISPPPHLPIKMSLLRLVAKDELDKLEKLNNNIENYTAAGGQLNQEQIEKASGLISEQKDIARLGEFATVASFLLELGCFGLSEILKEKTKKELANRQKEIREKLSSAANWIADGYFDGWKKSAESFRTQLEALRQDYIQKKESIIEKVNQISQLDQDLKEILSQPPV